MLTFASVLSRLMAINTTHGHYVNNTHSFVRLVNGVASRTSGTK